MITIEKRNKRSLTRPGYSLYLMGGEYDDLTMSSMRKVMKDSNEVCYAAYTVLDDADLNDSDVIRIHTDGESVAVTLKSSKLAKRVKELCNKTVVRYGTHFYDVKIKARDNIVIIDVQESDDVDFIDE